MYNILFFRHSGLDPESSGFTLDSRFRGKDGIEVSRSEGFLLSFCNFHFDF
jgi:hypothetical protein